MVVLGLRSVADFDVVLILDGDLKGDRDFSAISAEIVIDESIQTAIQTLFETGFCIIASFDRPLDGV